MASVREMRGSAEEGRHGDHFRRFRFRDSSVAERWTAYEKEEQKLKAEIAMFGGGE